MPVHGQTDVRTWARVFGRPGTGVAIEIFPQNPIKFWHSHHRIVLWAKKKFEEFCGARAASMQHGRPVACRGRSRRRNRSSDGSLPAKPNKILAFQSSNRSLVEEKNLMVFCGARAWPNGCSDLVTDVREAGHGSCDRNFPAKPHQILAFPSSNCSLGEKKI